MKNCIFCKIAAGEIPTQKTYEDDVSLAFLDLHPKAPGHTLLIPKTHHRWFYELPDEISDPLFRAAKQIAKNLKTEYEADFIQLSLIGTDVPHVHVHLVPKRLDAGEGALD